MSVTDGGKLSFNYLYTTASFMFSFSLINKKSLLRWNSAWHWRINYIGVRFLGDQSYSYEYSSASMSNGFVIIY